MSGVEVGGGYCECLVLLGCCWGYWFVEFIMIWGRIVVSGVVGWFWCGVGWWWIL